VSAFDVTPRRIVRAEWIKLTTLRSTIALFAASVALLLGLGVLSSLLTVNDWETMSAAQRDALQVGARVFAGHLFAQLTLGVLGVLAIAGEYATGTIRATLLAVPRRLPVLWAKLGLFAGATFALMTAASFATFFIGAAILAAHWDFSLSDPGTLRVVAMTGTNLTAVCVLGIALGFILRNTAAAISALIAIVLLAPLLFGEFAPRIAEYLPSGTMGALVTPTPQADVLAPWPAFVLLCLYVVAAIVAAAVALTRNDA
jgi:ABC-2 type transport system permease protein